MISVEMPIRADLECVPPNESEIKKFFDVVLDPNRQPCYIHCAFGKDRTGTMAALYRMEMDGWTSDEALQEMDSFCVWPAFGVMSPVAPGLMAKIGWTGV